MVITKWVGSHNYYLFMNFNFYIYIYVYPEPGLYGFDIHFARQMSETQNLGNFVFLLNF